ncbi:hypothetical protein AB0C13_36800, partial [Streptomyces sp. NPDC049099]
YRLRNAPIRARSTGVARASAFAWASSTAAWVPPAARPIGARAGELLRRSVDSAEHGDSLLAELRGFIAQVRAAAGADSFPLSFDSADTWRATLQLGYDWLRVGAHLNAELPIEEARDLLTGHGTQPHPALPRHQAP